MKQLTFIKARTLAWWDVPEPTLQAPCEALVRPFVVARCDGDAFFLRHNASPILRFGAALHVVAPELGHARNDPFQGPFAYGHECVAEVIAVGGEVRDHAVGDVVVVPWSIACGACNPCHRGLTSHCATSKTPVAAYGFSSAFGEHGGMVSDVVRVPYADAMLVSVPASIDPLAAASASDNMPDAFRAVGPQLQNNPQAPVLIVGGNAKSIGLYAAGMAVALGASQVDYLDTCRTRLDIAERLGARPILFQTTDAWFRRGEPVHPKGYAISVEASGTTRGLHYALSALTQGGVCSACAFYLRRATPLPLWNMYLKSTTLHVGVSHPRAHVPAVLELIRHGSFDPLKLRPLISGWEDASQSLLERATKVILQRKRLLGSSADEH